MDDVATALSFFSSASDIVNCDVSVGDTVVIISFSANASAEYIFDRDNNIKRAIIHIL